MSRTLQSVAPPPRLRTRLVPALAVSAAVVIAVLTPAFPALATAPAAATGPGWVRLAHLSPDTKAVDVRVSALAGGGTLYALDGVAYGAVSPYQQLPGGTYAVTMVPTGSSSSKPLLSARITVTAGAAATVAAFGSNKQLKLKTFRDDLTPPAAGDARVRLIQASTKVPTVNVLTTQGTAIATNAKAGSATSYASVPAGDWSLALTGKKVKQQAQVSLTAGSVSTILVLDDPSGLTLRPVLDSAAVAAAPVGGINTGGGYLASKGLTGPLKATVLEG